MTTDTQAEPTPGRIKYHAQGDANTYAILIDENDEWLLALLHNGRQATARQEANMRRIAACWNACDGVSTERLQSLAISLPESLHLVERDRAQLRAQADDLIAITARQTQELAAANALQARLVEALLLVNAHCRDEVAGRDIGEANTLDVVIDAALTAAGAA